MYHEWVRRWEDEWLFVHTVYIEKEEEINRKEKEMQNLRIYGKIQGYGGKPEEDQVDQSIDLRKFSKEITRVAVISCPMRHKDYRLAVGRTD
jgi:hypothetical protein